MAECDRSAHTHAEWLFVFVFVFQYMTNRAVVGCVSGSLSSKVCMRQIVQGDNYCQKEMGGVGFY